jgi:hypothetical protein
VTSRRWAALTLLLVLAGALSLACNRSKSEFSASQFQQADFQLRRATEAAERGDVNEAERAFFVAHNLLHQIDLPMRNRGYEDLANTLFEMKNDTEVEFAGQRRAAEIARLTREIRARLPEAAKALGAEYTSTE